MSTPRLRFPVATPKALASFRVLVAVAVLGAGDLWRLPLVVPGPTGPVQALVVVTLVAGALTLVGLFTRIATLVLAASLFVAIGLLQRGGTAVHAHHLAWLAALLVGSPCAEALSFDAWLRHRREGLVTGAPSTAFGAPLWLASTLLGFVYFFPGLHKLLGEASPFGDAAALGRLVRLKAFEAGAEVPFGLDTEPLLLSLGGAAVVTLELAVLGFAIFPRTRPVAGVLVLAFHAAMAVVVHIPFTLLAVFALTFFVPLRPGSASTDERPRCVTLAVGAVLLCGVAFAGARGDMRSFPFACYPTFAQRVPDTVSTLLVEVHREGRWSAVPPDALAPLDVRTAVLGAARRARTPAAAKRFLRQRMRDARFHDALDGATALRASRTKLDLTRSTLDVLDRRVLVEHPLDAL